MSVDAAAAIWMSLGGYLGFGFAFALFTVVFGLRRIDPLAAEAPVYVKAMWIPGLAALWPLMLVKLLRGREETAP